MTFTCAGPLEEHWVASAALHRPGTQRLLRERLESTQMLCLLHSAPSELLAKHVCVSHERYCAAVGQRLPSVQNVQLQLRSVRARQRGTECLMVHTLRTPRDAKAHIACMLWSGRSDECEPSLDSDFCMICTCIGEKIEKRICARMSGIYNI